jgi:hypothetical protein
MRQYRQTLTISFRCRTLAWFLCFDEQHTLFNRRRTENAEFYFVRKVRYSDNPPVSLATIDGDALLITKGTQWSYEKEWRMLVPLNDATRSMMITRDAVNLFAFPLSVFTRRDSWRKR